MALHQMVLHLNYSGAYTKPQSPKLVQCTFGTKWYWFYTKGQEIVNHYSHTELIICMHTAASYQYCPSKQASIVFSDLIAGTSLKIKDFTHAALCWESA